MMERPIAYVVEDNPDLASIFVEALTAAGYQTQLIDDGLEALSCISTHPPTLLLLDLHLPSMNGDQILHQLRAQEATKDLRVFIASADARMAELLRDDCTVVLHKPVGFVQLKQLATRFLP